MRLFKLRNLILDLLVGGFFLAIFMCIATAFSMPAKPPVQPVPSAPSSSPSVDGIKSIAVSGSCIAHSWSARGKAPAAYLQGMALSFAHEYCKLKSGDAVAKLASEANTGDDTHDAISWYNSNFKSIGMSNSGGVDTLRHLFILAISHGMQESSGKYCTGHDSSAGAESSSEAESGLFQTSANAVSSSPLLPGVLSFYQANPSKCFLDVFKQGVNCSASNLANVGSGQGAQFQQLLKTCPQAAVEVALVTLRVLRKHYGPINRKEAELYAPCDTMLSQVQSAVDAGSLCGSL